jgi:hypothetical protein
VESKAIADLTRLLEDLNREDEHAPTHTKLRLVPRD